MIYIDFLKYNINLLKFFYYNLLLKKLNFNFLYKLGFIKKKKIYLKIKKKISLLKTVINKKLYENFKRRSY